MEGALVVKARQQVVLLPALHVRVAQALLAAKPVVWRGQGDLFQLPVPEAQELRGRWLVVELWSGLSGLALALLSLGMNFIALAAEIDTDAVQCVKKCMPNIVHVDRVEDINIAMFQELLKSKDFRGVIIGGGSPCRPNSSLNPGRKGLQDNRALQPKILADMAA